MPNLEKLRMFIEICYKLIEVYEGPLTIGILAFTQNCINGVRAVLAPQHTFTCLEVHFSINRPFAGSLSRGTKPPCW